MTRHGSMGGRDGLRVRTPFHCVGGSRLRRTPAAVTTAAMTVAVTALTAAVSGHSHASPTDDRRSWVRPTHDGFPWRADT
jgi:hypothetical protein